jgi:hypothetical protein
VIREEGRSRVMKDDDVLATGGVNELPFLNATASFSLILSKINIFTLRRNEL